jgi:hypothetical protein
MGLERGANDQWNRIDPNILVFMGSSLTTSPAQSSQKNSPAHKPAHGASTECFHVFLLTVEGNESSPDLFEEPLYPEKKN